MADVNIDVDVSGIAELQSALAAFQLAIRHNIRREVAVLLREAAAVTKNKTPARTGYTRASIKTYVRFTAGGVEGEITAERAEAWLPRLERRYRMFAAGEAYFRRHISARVRRAINAAARQTIGSGG